LFYQDLHPAANVCSNPVTYLNNVGDKKTELSRLQNYEIDKGDI
jgi:hypothetical protein